MAYKKRTMNQAVWAALLLGSPLVWGETKAFVADSFKFCATITENAGRLACYDKLMVTDFGDAEQVAKLPLAQKEKPAIDLRKVFTSSKDAFEGTDVALLVTDADGSERTVPQTRVVSDPPIVVDTVPADIAEAYTPLSLTYDLYQNDPAGTFSLRTHKPNYLMPLWMMHRPNEAPHTPSLGTAPMYGGDMQRVETKFQLSFKTKVWEDLFDTRADLWFAYSQQSNWQVYNHAWSAPFRNTDYEPEVFITQPARLDLPFGFKLRMMGAGLVHQSNGRSEPWSRSWNRAYAMAGIEKGNWSIMPRIWWRIPAKDDNNPDISHYMGYGDLKVLYVRNKDTVVATARYNPEYNRGMLQLDYTFPLNGKLRGYVRYFNGYGENLLDYNHKQQGLGFGIMLNDWTGF